MKVQKLISESEKEEFEEFKKYLESPEVQHKIKAMTTPWRRAYRKVGMNEPCPCGSGKKYKKCCFIANLPKYTIDYD